MRCLYVIPKLHEKGGIQQFSLSIYNALRGRHEIVLKDWGNEVRFAEWALMRLLPQKMAVKRYMKTVKSPDIENFDIAHFWHLEPSIGARGRYVVSVHGMEVLEKNVRGYRRLLYRESLKNAEFVHVNSRFTARLATDNFGIDKERIRIITPPLTLRISHRHIESGLPVVGTISRFVKRKNIPTIIKALEILHESGVEFIYRLAGDGPLKDIILKELKRSGFRWEYLGEISEKDKIERFYPSLDVFALPPLELRDDVEGFGIVYLEANAYGIPVVAARTGGVSDAVKEGVSGIFADPEDAGDIAKKIGFLLKNRKKYEKSSRAWAEDFLPEKIAPRFERMYMDSL